MIPHFALSMNFIILRSIIETMATHFRCQQCQSTVEPHHINVIGANGPDLNVEITCPQCHSTTHLKAEINQFVPNSPDANRAFLEELAQKQGFQGDIAEVSASIQITQQGTPEARKPDTVSDKDVIDVHNKLKGGNITISDLFG
jgi:hypothetical protein